MERFDAGAPSSFDREMPRISRTASALIILTVSVVSAAAHGRPVRLFDDLALSPDGRTVASVEHDEPSVDGVEPTDFLVTRPTVGGRSITVSLPCGSGPECKPSDLAFSPDGQHLAFILKQPNDPRSFLFEVNRDGSGLTELLAYDGVLQQPRYADDGTLALLATAGTHDAIGAIKPGTPLSGEVGVSAYERRIAILHGKTLTFVSPADLFVYEFSWLPNGSGFVGTASHGNGDDDWWIAKLWSFPRNGSARVIYVPPPRQQIANPVVSPDGARVAFIGGLMSDFGSTGGDAFVLSLDGRSKPVDWTSGLPATVTGIAWGCSPDALTATVLRGAQTELLSLSGSSGPRTPVWTGEESLGLGGWSSNVACSKSGAATIRQTFRDPPEIAFGRLGDWRDVTDVNRGLHAPVIARSLTWHSDGWTVQGWLLQPEARINEDNQRMITQVHGGPSAASIPEYVTDERDLWLLNAGYDLFLPNPRGSFGQGEAFTQANVRDFGHGDLRDILHGVDQVLKAAPIDPDALGLTGYSYGGYMTMWAVTQTDRFKAAVAGAGVSDWLSYYGENGIDRWMIPFFGASVYDDPAIYARSSPINYVRHARTPTFVFVGDRDLECPMPQSEEFWHALRELGVPTKFVVYPGQGHELESPADRADAKRRSLAWFGRWLAPATR